MVSAMTRDFQLTSLKRAAWLGLRLSGLIVFGLLICPVAKAGPPLQDAANAGAAMPSSNQSHDRSGDRSVARSGALDASDSRKLRRLQICMQSLGGPMHLLEAVNICAPCISPVATGNLELTGAERSCVNRRQNNNGQDGAQSAVGGDLQPAHVEPNCAGTKTGRGPQADRIEDMAAERLEAGRNLTAAGEQRDNARRELAETSAATESEEFDDLLQKVHEAQNLVDQRRREWDAAWSRGRSNRRPGVDVAGGDLPGGGVEDPRCAGKHRAAEWGVPWQDMCRSEDGKVDLIACVRKMVNVVSVITGGRCWMEKGPDDAPTIVCKEEDGQTAGIYDRSNGGGAVGPTDNSETDATPWNRPNRRSEAAGPVTDPLEDFLGDLCARGGCPDPAPTHGAVETVPDSNLRSGGATPKPCPKGTEKRGEACVAIAKRGRLEAIKPLIPGLQNKLRSLTRRELRKIRKAKRKSRQKRLSVTPKLLKQLPRLGSDRFTRSGAAKAKQKRKAKVRIPNLRNKIGPALKLF